MTATGTTMGLNELSYIRAPIAKLAGRFSSGKTPTMMSQTTKREGLDELHLTEAFQPSRADCVEKMVAAAVLFQAVEDLQKFRHERRAAGQMLYNEVRDWVTANDPGWPGSFLNVCRALQLAPRSCGPIYSPMTRSRMSRQRYERAWVSDVPSMELRFFEMSGGKNLRKGQNTQTKNQSMKDTNFTSAGAASQAPPTRHEL